jgi:hypothetical protein
MFRSTTIFRELVLSLVKLYYNTRCNDVVIGYVVVWQHVFEWRVCCVLCTAHNTHATV